MQKVAGGDRPREQVWDSGSQGVTMDPDEGPRTSSNNGLVLCPRKGYSHISYGNCVGIHDQVRCREMRCDLIEVSRRALPHVVRHPPAPSVASASQVPRQHQPVPPARTVDVAKAEVRVEPPAPPSPPPPAPPPSPQSMSASAILQRARDGYRPKMTAVMLLKRAREMNSERRRREEQANQKPDGRRA